MSTLDFQDDSQAPFMMFEVPESMQTFVRYLAIGNNEDYENQLLSKSRQAHILKYTPNDAAKRFVDKSTLEAWRAKGRTMHWLLSDQLDLAGIIWYRKKEFPKSVPLKEIPSETFAIRLYEGYVGHHLSIPFMKFSLQTAVRLKLSRGEEVEGMWLQTIPSNEAAIASYTKFGYQEVYRDNKEVIMTMDSSDIMHIVNTPM
jgi:hypothetical protein